MPLVNCEINLILTWSANCVISESDSPITYKTLCFCCDFINSRYSVVTLSTQDNTKLRQQLKFKRKIN